VTIGGIPTDDTICGHLGDGRMSAWRLLKRDNLCLAEVGKSGHKAEAE